MDNIKFWGYWTRIMLVINLVHCETEIDWDKYNWFRGSRFGSRSAAQFQFVTLVEPQTLNVMMENDMIVTFNYTVPCETSMESYTIAVESDNLRLFTLQGNTTFQVICTEAVGVDSAYDAISNNNQTDQYSTNKTSILAARGSFKVKMHGILLGIAALKVKLRNDDTSLISDMIENINSTDVIENTNGTDVMVNTFTVGILRLMRPIDMAFRGIVAFFICLVILAFGCGLNLEVVKECLKKPIAPAIGLGCQYILMPLIGYTVAKLVPIDNRAISFGIFVCGVCPGGGASNIYTYLLGGDVNLSITMTLISTVASLGMMPLWVYTLGRQFVEEDFEIIVPYTNMLQTLAMITIPLFVGIFIKYKYFNVAKKLIKVLKPVTIVMILIFMVVGIYSNFYIFQLFRPKYILAGALLPYGGYLSGGIIAAILQQPWTRIKTIALETGMQNVGVAFFLMVTSFPPPLGDISALAPAASAMMTPVPPFLVAVPYLIYKRCTRRAKTVDDMIDDEIKVAKNGDIVDTKKAKQVPSLADRKGKSGTEERKPMILEENLTSV